MDNETIKIIEDQIHVGVIHEFWKTSYQYGSEDGRYEVLKELGLTDDYGFKKVSDFCTWFKSAISHMTEDQKKWTADAMTEGFYEYLYGDKNAAS